MRAGRRVPSIVGGSAAVVAIVVVSTALIWGLGRVVGGDADPVDGPTSGVGLTVAGPSRLEAGTNWDLTVSGHDADLATVDVWGAFGVRRLKVVVDGDRLRIPADLTVQSGHLTASVSIGSATGVSTVDVDPTRAVDGIVPLAGPRSMVADGAHWTMVTAIPTDRFGNSVADGTPVRLHVRRPDGTTDLIDATVEHLLAGIRVPSTTTAGRSTIRVEVDGATGPEVEVSEVPGPPVDVDLERPATMLLADGRSLHSITTGRLVDRFGNELLDGTSVSYSVSGAAGAGTATSVTIGGRSELVIEAPPERGVVEVTATVDGVTSPALTLDFQPDVAAIPVAVDRADDRVSIDVGPVLTGLGGYVPDGTDVTVSGDGVDAIAEVRGGLARLEVVAPTGTELVVEVLGVRTEVVAP